MKTETDGVGYGQITHMSLRESGSEPMSERAYVVLFAFRARMSYCASVWMCKCTCRSKLQCMFTRICVGVCSYERACKGVGGGSAGGLEMLFFIGLWCVSVSTTEDTQ